MDVNDAFIVSGDAKSTICVKNRASGKISKIRHGDQHSEVKAIRLGGEVAAIGYEKGIIYVVNLEDNNTVARLRGHDGDIQARLLYKLTRKMRLQNFD